MRYAVIASQVGEYSVSTLCRTFDVSASGYDTWRRRHPSRHRAAR
jgi:transposase-like protein